MGTAWKLSSKAKIVDSRRSSLSPGSVAALNSGQRSARYLVPRCASSVTAEQVSAARNPAHDHVPAERIVAELRTALQRLGIDPPYILVGHSIGGLFVRAFAGLHPGEVAGIVLLDPTMEFRESLPRSQVDTLLQQHWSEDYGEIQGLLNRTHPKMAAIAAQSLLDLEPYLKQVAAGDRAETRGEWLRLFTDRVQQIEGMLPLMSDAERQELFATMETMRTVRDSPMNGVPISLLIAGKSSPRKTTTDKTSDPTLSADYIAWAQRARSQRFAEFIEAAPNRTMVSLSDSGHNIPNDRPDAIVEAIKQQVARVSQ